MTDAKPAAPRDLLELRELVRAVPDFPKPGIVFRDITSLLETPGALRDATRALVAPFRARGVERVLGIESRGFLFGATAAVELGVGCALIRKPGKLPRATHAQRYQLEYGEDAIEIHRDAVSEGQRVLLVDDVLATGGTAAAACALARRAGAVVLGCAFLIELSALAGRARLGGECHAVLEY